MQPRFDLLIPDINGLLRGLSAPIADAEGLLANAVPWSSSLFASRFDGAVVEESGYGLAVGDPDFPLHAVAGTEAPVPWQEGGAGRQGIYRMFRPSGTPFELDPQQALRALLKRLAQEGWEAILATEFEFYLTEAAIEQPDGKSGFADLYSLDEINRQGPFFSLLNDYAAAQNISTGNIISEYGAGQWEVNLGHKEAMRAVLEGVLLRRLVRATAERCGKRATFMAKPYSDSSGSGMHIHLSLWRDGKNCFADETVLLQAVAGVLAITNEAMAIFAPYDNSFRRFLPNSYAPSAVNWGRENRSVAVRLPQATTDAEKRLEFRLCGADVNPILVAAALLAGVHWGMTQQLTPPPAYEGGADAGEGVARCWRSALDNFATARILPQYFDERFLSNFLCIKENEWRHQRAYITDYDRQYYGRVL